MSIKPGDIIKYTSFGTPDPQEYYVVATEDNELLLVRIERFINDGHWTVKTISGKQVKSGGEPDRPSVKKTP